MSKRLLKFVGTIVAIAASWAPLAGSSAHIGAAVPEAPLTHSTSQGSESASGASSQGANVLFQGAVPSWAASGSAQADLEVYKWPDLSNVVAGQTIPLTLVGQQPISGSQFSISLPSSASTNYNFVIESPLYYSSVTTGGLGSENSRIPVALSPLVSPATQNDLRVKSVLVSGFKSFKRNSSVVGHQSLRSAHTSPSQINGCNATLLTPEGDKAQRVGEAHTSAYATASYTFTVGTSAAITASLSLTSSTSGFSANGTWSNSGGASVPLSIGPSEHDFVTMDYRWAVFQLSCGLVRPVQEWENIAYEFVGLPALQKNVAPTNPLGYCPINYAIHLGSAPNSNPSYTSFYGSSNTWNAGFSLFGVSISDLMSYDMQTSIAYQITQSSPVTYLCGINGGSPNGSPIVYNSTVAQ